MLSLWWLLNFVSVFLSNVLFPYDDYLPLHQFVFTMVPFVFLLLPVKFTFLCINLCSFTFVSPLGLLLLLHLLCELLSLILFFWFHLSFPYKIYLLFFCVFTFTSACIFYLRLYLFLFTSSCVPFEGVVLFFPVMITLNISALIYIFASSGEIFMVMFTHLVILVPTFICIHFEHFIFSLLFLSYSVLFSLTVLFILDNMRLHIFVSPSKFPFYVYTPPCQLPFT